MKKTGKQMTLREWMQLWALRVLTPQAVTGRFVKERGFADDDAAELVGLGQWLECERKSFDPERIIEAMRDRHAELELRRGRSCLPVKLKPCIDKFGRVLKLTTIEKQILLVLAVCDADSAMTDVVRVAGSKNLADHQLVLARMLNVAPGKVKAATASHSKLLQSCIVEWRNHGHSTGFSLEFVKRGFGGKLIETRFDLAAAIRTIAPPAPAPTLGIQDFEHAKEHLDYLLPYLQEVAETRRPGVNIFIHGAPGTGKSELVRLLAKTLRCHLYEIAFEDSDRDAADGNERLQALRSAQMLVRGHRSFLVFDEAEDVFARESLFRRSLAQTRKAWLNRMLESNLVPTFWISNSLEGLDGAFARRFDFIFELSTPPRHQRLKVFRNSVDVKVSEQLLERLSNCDALTPAVVARAADVVRQIRKRAPEVAVEGAIQHLVTQTLKAQGHATHALSAKEGPLPTVYDLEFLNCATPLAPIAAQMDKTSSCRICLYGAPGTGKTCFGHWLAHKLGLPIQIKRASDILGPYVGESERRLAHAFRSAAESGAILLLDEVDTFLQDRRNAQRSWEVSLVNEMLTQMESFPGIFIASTNLMNGLDEAALRRFDLKLQFNWLEPHQAQRLLASHCKDLAIGVPSTADLQAIAACPTLAPGDFANVARQHRFRKFRDSAEFTAALLQECDLKSSKHSKTVGFA